MISVILSCLLKHTTLYLSTLFTLLLHGRSVEGLTLRAIARTPKACNYAELHDLCNPFLFIKTHHFLLKYTFYPTTARPFG